MANGKPLDLNGIEAYEEWCPIPADWRCIGKKDTTTKKGTPEIIVVFLDGQRVERAVFSWALRKEPGKQFEILKRILPQYLAPARV